MHLHATVRRVLHPCTEKSNINKHETFKSFAVNSCLWCYAANPRPRQRPRSLTLFVTWMRVRVHVHVCLSRHREPDLPRPFRVWLIIPILFCIIAVGVPHELTAKCCHASHRLFFFSAGTDYVECTNQYMLPLAEARFVLPKRVNNE